MIRILAQRGTAFFLCQTVARHDQGEDSQGYGSSVPVRGGLGWHFRFAFVDLVVIILSLSRSLIRNGPTGVREGRFALKSGSFHRLMVVPERKSIPVRHQHQSSILRLNMAAIASGASEPNLTLGHCQVVENAGNRILI